MIRQALIVSFAAAAFITLPIGAQTADEHASHHPGAAGSTGAPLSMPPAPPGAPSVATNLPTASAWASGAPGVSSRMSNLMGKMSAPANLGAAAAPAAAGGMQSMMASMMGSMMVPASPGGCMGGACGPGAATLPIYPSLMTLPVLTPEKRAEIDLQATQQINEGAERYARGSESFARAREVDDYAAMQDSVGRMREGLDELGAGIAARRVLLEGKAPRNLALDWFKREMNLASPISRDAPRAHLGVTPFHLFTMVLLVAFALATVAMYFFKMRRTAALFGRIEGDSGAPPPGSAPPLAGTDDPSAPIAPPTGATPAAPNSPAVPVADTPTASAASALTSQPRNPAT